MATDSPDFDELITGWARAACFEWRYPDPSEAWRQKVSARLPSGLRNAIANGVEGRLIVPEGYKFRLAGLPEYKGPYSWLSRSLSRSPAPNWEYFIQAAEYVRLQSELISKGYTVLLEDDLMDLSVY